MHRAFPAWLLSSLAFLALQAETQAVEKSIPPSLAYPTLSAEDNARIAWWLDARYGMFIHWGVASIKGVELSWARGGSKPLDIHKHPAGYVEDPVYDNLYKQFNPTEFNPKEWVRIAKAAGMKYMVLTAKHHDGFCLWDSKLTDYTIMKTPFKRDVVKEFTAACHEAGMRVGLYYSQRDWHHPAYGIGDNAIYRDYMNGQLTELLSNYGPIDVIWFDSYGTGDLKTFWGIDETWQLIKRLAPKAVVNNRLAILASYNKQGEPYLGDFDTPEQSIGKMQTTRPWESCMCFVGHQWGFKPNGEMYTLDKLIRAIVSCATGDGNLLMNVGPMPTGQIEQRQADRLKEAGDWLTAYGHSIYNTRGGPYRNAKWGGSTRRGNTVFIHVFDWKGQETLRLLPLPQKITASRVLTGGTVVVTQTANGIDLAVPVAERNAINTIIELTLDAPSIDLVKGESIRSIFEGGGLGEVITAGAVVTLSSSAQGNSMENLQRLFDPANKPAPATDIQDDPWISIDLGRTRTVKGLRIEPLNGNDRKLESLVVQVSTDGQTWNEAWRCPAAEPILECPITTVVAGAAVPGVQARHVRLMIRSAKSKLALRHVQVHGE
jgi:alpha-L-fucosidase